MKRASREGNSSPRRARAPAATEGAPPVEPLYISIPFERDPIGAARDVICRVTARDAQAASDGSETRRWGRAALAMEVLATRTRDDAMLNEAAGEASRLLSLAAQAPAASLDDVELKLALLARSLMTDAGGELDTVETLRLALTVEALAELMLLRTARIELPPGATETIKTEEQVAHWRERAGEAP
jgi:hypothetical protein